MNIWKLLFFGMLIFNFATGQQEAASGQNDTLIAQLDTIFREDQKYRRQVKDIEVTYGRESNELKEHWELIQRKDSINLIKIQKILDEHGWLGADKIGEEGNATLFLVIQHAPLEVQENYVPLIRDAVKKGNAQPGNLAILEDRIAVRNGKRQRFGSQIGRDQETGEYYILPLLDPENVDKRRQEVGLGTLQEYISRWGLTWDVELYKKSLPELEAKLNE
jgi:hypothetical protein